MIMRADNERQNNYQCCMNIDKRGIKQRKRKNMKNNNIFDFSLLYDIRTQIKKPRNSNKRNCNQTANSVNALFYMKEIEFVQKQAQQRNKQNYSHCYENISV